MTATRCLQAKLRSLYRGFLFIRVCSNSRVVSIIHSDNQEKKENRKKIRKSIKISQKKEEEICLLRPFEYCRFSP